MTHAKAKVAKAKRAVGNGDVPGPGGKLKRKDYEAELAKAAWS